MPTIMDIEILNKYKSFLDWGTNQGLGYNDENCSRWVSFMLCAERLKDKSNLSIIELGTCRSFVDGQFEGCNLDDAKYWKPENPEFWDWGAGCFILMFGQLFNGCDLTTLDLMRSHIARSKVMTDSLGIKCDHVVSDSVSYLKATDKQYDLIYVDTGDMWPIEPTAQLQLDECKVIVERNLLKEGGILLIDDVRNKVPKEYGDINNEFGKSKYALEYLLNNGFHKVYTGYQYILMKDIA